MNVNDILLYLLRRKSSQLEAYGAERARQLGLTEEGIKRLMEEDRI